MSLIALRSRHAAGPATPMPAGGAAGRARRWALAGVLVGGLLGGLLNLPASLVSSAVSQATGDRLLLAEAQGTVWQGSALAVLSAGPGSRDAPVVLPTRLGWQLHLGLRGLDLRLDQACCLAPGLALRASRADGAWRLALLPGTGQLVAQWPASWLEGLGFPWNTLHPGGLLRLSAPDLALVGRSGHWRLQGGARLEFRQAAAALTTLDTLGSYQLSIDGDPVPAPGAPAAVAVDDTLARLHLSTLSGALQLQGRGALGPRGLHFRGEAQAAPGAEAALNNLLNIIGRRNGAQSVISIG